MREKLLNLTIEERIKYLIEFVNEKRIKIGVSYPIKIIAVTKNFDETYILRAINSGINDIGENRVQEAREKFSKLKGIKFEKHLIGHLQTNKVNKAIEIFDVIQSIDSIELARKINVRLSHLNKSMPVMIEVNTSFEPTKFGVRPDETIDLAGQILELKYLDLAGLMTVGPLTDDKKRIREAFKLLYNTGEKLKKTSGKTFLHLSMGMSDDFEIAIEEGSTMIRLGRIIFGDRN